MNYRALSLSEYTVCVTDYLYCGAQYQELFSVCQALSGPASTKMHYCINLIHDGFPSAVLGFLIWR